MRWTAIGVVALAIFSMLAPLAQAQGLDTVVLPVDSRSEADRQQALAEGLNEMLVRLSGSSQVVDKPVAASAAKQLDRWVTRSDYSGDGRLTARYDSQGLMALLASEGVAVWGLPRPRLLVWLVDQGTGQGTMVSADHPLYGLLSDEARRRGLSLVVPRWDDSDQQALSVADIRGRFDDRLLAASKAYPHDLVLSAVLYAGNPSTVSWRVLQGRKELEKGRKEADNSGEALMILVDSVTDQLAARYAVAGARSDLRTLLVVEGISSLKAAMDLRTYLSGLGGMQRASLAQMSGTSFTYALDFAASDEQLRDLLDLSSHLQACPDPTVPGPQWRYCWQD